MCAWANTTTFSADDAYLNTRAYLFSSWPRLHRNHLDATVKCNTWLECGGERDHARHNRQRFQARQEMGIIGLL